jgi:hypothetical protein
MQTKFSSARLRIRRLVLCAVDSIFHLRKVERRVR